MSGSKGQPPSVHHNPLRICTATQHRPTTRTCAVLLLQQLTRRLTNRLMNFRKSVGPTSVQNPGLPLHSLVRGVLLIPSHPLPPTIHFDSQTSDATTSGLLLVIQPLSAIKRVWVGSGWNTRRWKNPRLCCPRSDQGKGRFLQSIYAE